MNRCPYCLKLPNNVYSPKTDRWSLFCACIDPSMRCDGHILRTDAIDCWDQYVAQFEKAVA